MFDDLKIRNKLILLVAGPLVIIVLLAALGARSRQDTASASQRVERLVSVSRANSTVVDALQAEALYSTAFVGSDRSSWKAEMAEARKATDQALADTLARLEDTQSTSANYRAASGLASDAANKLIYIRETVDQGYRWEQAADTYGALQDTFLAVNQTVTEAISDPQVAGQLRTAGALANYKASIAAQSSLLVGAVEAGGFGDNRVFALLRGAVDDEASGQAIFNSVADAERKGDVRDSLISAESIALTASRDQAVDAGATGKLTADPKALTTSTATVLDDLHEVETDLFGTVISQSQASRSEAERAANLFVAAALFAILAAAAAAILLGRRITRPLDSLTVAANRLATEQMPRLVESLRNPSDDELTFQLDSMQAIEVSSKDEIGQLASSFNDVQRVASEVAAEQAALLRKGIGEMFVNLARRNQTLLDRQIEFIDELERTEEDPDQLENLYRLDHLATRMRRNAESLLVLAGAEPPRRRGRAAPLANVVRAALAEVEDFNRIELLSFDEVLIASNVAADLAHLLSELMENATNFSPPETRVEVVGHRTSAEGYVISVSDQGIGMSADQILEANESLAKPPLVGLALSRSLGFIVVGRLSGRHGITVRMMASPSGGVAAVVTIPPALVTDAPSLGQMGTGPTAVPDSPEPLAAVADQPDSGSVLAPLTFTPHDTPTSPATLADAVPTGRAFDDGLEGLVGDPPPPSPIFGSAPSGPSTSSTNGASKNGLPTRRLSATPTAPAAQPEPVASTEPEPEPEVTPDLEPAPAVESATPEPVAEQTTTLPEALLFHDQAPADAEVLPTARLDGPPPAAPTLPTRNAPARPPAAAPAAEEAARPFFLDEAEPPRLYGRGAEAAPDAPAGAPARLFGNPAAPPATSVSDGSPPAAPAPSAPEPLVARTPAAAPEAPAAETEAAVQTSAGLTKRVPRQAGATRAIPGADAERGVSATRRSPDEVRNLLSRYRAGTQRARVEESVPTGPATEKDTHE